MQIITPKQRQQMYNLGQRLHKHQIDFQTYHDELAKIYGN